MLIKNSKPKCIWKSKSILGEGVIWVPDIKSVIFVDIKKKKILIYKSKKNKKIFKINKEIGFISHLKKNIFILGLQSELRILNIKTMKIIFSIGIETNKLNNRINDGKTDPDGRLWFSTMDNFEKKKSGSLYCLDKKLNLHKVDNKYFTPNGPAFINKNNFYHTDSRKKIIYKIKINKNFEILKKTHFIKFNKEDGSPDGMTLDKNNNLLVCHYGGAAITVFNKNGKKIHKIFFPAKNITNCVFGGKLKKELFVSSAIKGMKLNDIKKFPLSGSLFKVETNMIGKKNISFQSKYLFY